MSAKLRLPRGLQTVTFVVAVLAFGALTVGVGLTASLQATPELAASPVSQKS